MDWRGETLGMGSTRTPRAMVRDSGLSAVISDVLMFSVCFSKVLQNINL